MTRTSAIDLQAISQVREFNRFYTQKIGILNKKLHNSAFSLTEVRVLFELVHRQSCISSELAEYLDLDAGYLSRILNKFNTNGFITQQTATQDKRQKVITLTPKGKKAFAELNQRSQQRTENLLAPLSASSQAQLTQAMHQIQGLLAPTSEQKNAPYIVRSHRAGDLGWVIHRHGVLYANEYGWNHEFEAMVAENAAHFLRDFNPDRENAWVAEKNGKIVGFIAIRQYNDTTSKIRMFYVEPDTRGMGIGKHLVNECIRFSREKQYQSIILDTYENLSAARHIYGSVGFQCIESYPVTDYGHNIMSETWEMALKN